MKNKFELKYSDDALLARVLFLASSKELNIFVEDEGKEYEYEEIFERLLPDKLKINIIFPTGGKTKLEEAFSLFGNNTEYGKCFFIADGDFDIALGRKQINADNFLYLKKYNIESYLLDKSVIMKFMRPKLKTTIVETDKIVDINCWETIIVPYFKKIFALHFIVQKNMLGIENVAKQAPYFITNEGLQNESNFKRYLKEIKNFDSKIHKKINESIEQLESIYGKEASDFVCGKYLIESLSRYLGSKLKKKKIGYDELKSFLISNFDVEEIGYIKEKLFYYIAH